MLQTVEAVVDVDGTIRWLEPLPIRKPSRVLVTLLEEKNGTAVSQSNAVSLLEFLRNHRLPESARVSVEEIEAQIEENRNAWD